MLKNKLFLNFLVLVFGVTLISGCGTTRTSTSETSTVGTTAPAVETDHTVAADTGQRTEVKKTTVEEQPKSGIATVWEGIGTVLAFPFELVANIIKFIF